MKSHNKKLTQNNRCIVHIGLGKTGSTTLQSIIFPKICAKNKFHYRSSLDEQLQGLLFGILYDKPVLPIQVQQNTFFSNQGLAGWDPYKWPDCGRKILHTFGKKAEILLIIREPVSYLNSVYIQRCIHEANISTPEDYFLSRERYSPLLPTPKFLLEDFNYKNLIKIYQQRFEKVVVVKYENLSNLIWLKQFFQASSKDLSLYQSELLQTSTNRSYSARSVKLTLALSSLLNRFGLRLKDSDTVLATRYLNKTAKRSFLEGAHDGTNFDNQDLATIDGVIKKIKKEFVWRNFVQQRLDRFFEYQKYYIDFSTLRFFDIQKAQNDYLKIPSISVHSNCFVSKKSSTKIVQE